MIKIVGTEPVDGRFLRRVRDWHWDHPYDDALRDSYHELAARSKNGSKPQGPVRICIDGGDLETIGSDNTLDLILGDAIVLSPTHDSGEVTVGELRKDARDRYVVDGILFRQAEDGYHQIRDQRYALVDRHIVTLGTNGLGQAWQAQALYEAVENSRVLSAVHRKARYL